MLLRDDKSFPYILITGDHKAPQIAKHRGARTRKGDYFGPFASAGAVGRTINALQRAFLLRSCSDAVFDSRTRPCLLYQIKRCSAPCTGEISARRLRRRWWTRRRTSCPATARRCAPRLQPAMEEAAERLDFEQAARYRDRLAALSHVQSHQGINPQTVEEADVFAVHQDGGQTCIQVFFFRTGQNWGNRAYFPRADKGLGAGRGARRLPRPVLRRQAGAEADPAVARFRGAGAARGGARASAPACRSSVTVPQRGEKKDLVDHALANAREALGRELAQASSQRTLLDGLAERFGLAEPPRRIEVYDNSHIMGTNAVGGMIVAGPEGFVKGQYRKFNMRSETSRPATTTP